MPPEEKPWSREGLVLSSKVTTLYKNIGLPTYTEKSCSNGSTVTHAQKSWSRRTISTYRLISVVLFFSLSENSKASLVPL